MPVKRPVNTLDREAPVKRQRRTPVQRKLFVSGLKCLAIVGSRHLRNKVLFRHHVLAWIAEHGQPSKIVSGGATGADELAVEFALEHGIEFVAYNADWDRFGRSAGPMRNIAIVGACTHVLAFVAPDSVGTRDTLNKAARAARHITLVEIQ